VTISRKLPEPPLLGSCGRDGKPVRAGKPEDARAPPVAGVREEGPVGRDGVDTVGGECGVGHRTWGVEVAPLAVVVVEQTPRIGDGEQSALVRRDRAETPLANLLPVGAPIQAVGCRGVLAGHVAHRIQSTRLAAEADDARLGRDDTVADGGRPLDFCEGGPRLVVVARESAVAGGHDTIGEADHVRPREAERLAPVVGELSDLVGRSDDAAVGGRDVRRRLAHSQSELPHEVARDRDAGKTGIGGDEGGSGGAAGVDAFLLQRDVLVCAHTRPVTAADKAVSLRTDTDFVAPAKAVPMNVFGSSGVRGVVGETITPAFVGRVAKAAGSTLGAETVAVARDTRRTGGMLADAAAGGLAAVGSDVHRLGVAPTPAAQAYAEREGVPVVMITASHNPPAYNGVKLIGGDGIELSRDALERIEDRLLSDRYETKPWNETGESERVESTRRAYVDQLLAVADREQIADADLTVALDPGHGAGALTSPDFFRELGCRVVTVNAQPDGHFPGRDPEPVAENLDDLGALVRATDADVGIAHDGDADRAIFYDEHGDYIEGDATLAALAEARLDAGDTAVSAVNVSQRLVDVTSRVDADLELTPIGSTYIITRIRELQNEGEHVPVAGEGNGGILFPNYRLARDGAYTAASFLELLADQSASEAVADYGGYVNVRRNVEYDSDAEREALLAAVESYAEAADAEPTTTDGYRLDYGDAWVLARPSGTEPVVRIYAEARDRDRAESLVGGVHERLRAALE